MKNIKAGDAIFFLKPHGNGRFAKTFTQGWMHSAPINSLGKVAFPVQSDILGNCRHLIPSEHTKGGTLIIKPRLGDNIKNARKLTRPKHWRFRLSNLNRLELDNVMDPTVGDENAVVCDVLTTQITRKTMRRLRDRKWMDDNAITMFMLLM